MEDVTIQKERIHDLVARLMQRSTVVAPVRAANQVSFKPISTPAQVEWGYRNTTTPPSEHLLPQTEVMFRYEQRGSDINLSYELDHTPRTILGIRPCDVHSLRMLDEIFQGRYHDPYYLTRRANTTLIALMCNEPGDHCFCSSFGTGPDLHTTDNSGADLMLVDLGDRYYVRVLSERGWHIVEQQRALFSPLIDADREAVAAAAAETTSKIKRHLDMEGVPEVLAELFESDYWDKIARKCLACGACTYLCPVCYCYDVTDTCSAVEGERVRCWDACTYRSFAMLSGGHNPRPTIKEGYRQKMYHKFSYALERHGHALCVGCGRCTEVCPVSMDIVRVLNEAKLEVEAREVV
jgi:ferredoxin